MSRSRVTRLTIFAFSRARRFDCQVGVSPEAECSILQCQLLPAVEPKLLQKNAAVPQTERAFTRGPTRDSRVCRSVRDARVHIPAAKFHLIQMKLAAAGQFSQEFVAAHAFGFHLQSPLRETAQSLRNSARSRQLRQIHAVQF